MTPWPRRTVLGAGLGIGIGALWPVAGWAQSPVVPRPQIHPRSDWTKEPPRAALLKEPEVLFLIVHHSETPNGESGPKAAARLRSMYSYHTGAKAWADIAYNFLVDAGGGIWEGRAGSLSDAIQGDATGGNQGFDQLCCFMGDHQATPPTAAAMQSMTSLLAWLAQRYDIDLSEGRQVSFVSRGSNRWTQGSKVITDPIAGHRDLSQTSCPGDALYPLVRSQLLVEARKIVGVAATPSESPYSPTVNSSTGTSATSVVTPAKPGEHQRAPDSILEQLGFGAIALGVLGGVGATVLLRKRTRRERQT